MAYKIKTSKIKLKEKSYSVENEPNIKRDLEQFKRFSKEDITRSDLQGNAMTYGIKYVGSEKVSSVSEIENIFLLYADGEIDINTAKRYILEIRSKNGI